MNVNRQPKGYVTLGPLVAMTIRTPSGKRERIQFLGSGSGDEELLMAGPGIFDHLPRGQRPEMARDDIGKMHIVNQTRSLKTGNLRGRFGEKLIDDYTALHEGAAPNEFFLEKPLHKLGRYDIFGSIEDAEYWKRTKERNEHIYKHPFEMADDKQPELVLSSRNELRIIKQDHVTVTERGIEDMSHALRSSYRHRRNPFTAERSTRAVMSAGTAGITGIVTILGSNYLLGMINAKITDPAKQITGYKAATAKVVTGVVASILADAYLPEKFGAPIAAGLGVGGVIGGGMDAIATYRVANPAPVVVVNPPAPPAQPPAHFPYGLPYAQPQAQQYAQPQYQYGQVR